MVVTGNRTQNTMLKPKLTGRSANGNPALTKNRVIVTPNQVSKENAICYVMWQEKPQLLLWFHSSCFISSFAQLAASITVICVWSIKEICTYNFLQAQKLVVVAYIVWYVKKEWPLISNETEHILILNKIFQSESMRFLNRSSTTHLQFE